MTSTIEVHGHCEPRFAAVEERFARNFEDGLEVGASFAATLDGEFVVDIWAGHENAACTRPWKRDTIVNVYSTTKAMAALCTLMLVDRGQLDLDAPVAAYWPEFAQGGKEKLPVRYLLSHTAGLAGFSEPVSTKDLYDWDHIVSLLAAQEPWWEPGTQSGYHAITFGFLLGEVVRRISGKTPGTFFRDEVAVPLQADFHIGLPEEHEARVGELIPPPGPRQGVSGEEPDSILTRVNSNPPLRAEESRDRAWRAAEMPAVNGHGNARSVARVAAALACGGTLGGVKLLTPATIEKVIEEQYYGPDLVIEMSIRWGLGFGLPSKEMPIGPNPRAFYWGSWGGSVIVVDLDARVSFAYVMNKMSANTMGDKRVSGPAMALYGGLA